MRKWYAVFVDSSGVVNLGDEIVEEWELEAGALKRFKDAVKAGEVNGRVVYATELNGRMVYAMWIIDHSTEQEDVIAISGNVSSDIRARYNAYMKRQQ